MMSTNDYMSRVRRKIQDAYPNLVDTHVLNAILPAILLALVAQRMNVIFTTSSVQELQRSINKVLSTVFGLQTKRIKIRSLQSPQDLLMSLFVPTSPTSSSTSSHKRRTSHSTMSRSHSVPHPPSSYVTEGSDSATPFPLASPRFSRNITDSSSDPQTSFHLPQTILISGLERAGRAAQLSLADALRTRRIILENDDNNGSFWSLPDEFFVIYISALGDGCERPAIHTTLLDHFAFSVTLNPKPVPVPTPSSSPRLPPLPLSPQPQKPPLLPLDLIPHPDDSALAPLISHYVTALLSAARHHPELDGMLLTARCIRDTEAVVRASGVVFREDEENGMISDLHVRRVVPPVLAHRLRVRNSLREQILGTLWKDAGVNKWGECVEGIQCNRRTVKEIIAEILAEV